MILLSSMNWDIDGIIVYLSFFIIVNYFFRLFFNVERESKFILLGNRNKKSYVLYLYFILV